MPYLIRKRDDQNYEIINKGNGQTISHHSSYKKAVKAVKAIYANERKKEWPQWYK